MFLLANLLTYLFTLNGIWTVVEDIRDYVAKDKHKGEE